MGIIEKLGITQIERRYVGDYDVSEGYIAVCRDESVEELERQRDEMLEALIDIVSKFQRIVPTKTKYVQEYQDEFLANYDIQIKAIEKATGKTWEEIKEL